MDAAAAAASLAFHESLSPEGQVALVGGMFTLMAAMVTVVGTVIVKKIETVNRKADKAAGAATASAEAVQAVHDEVITNHGRRLGAHVEHLVDWSERMDQRVGDLAAVQRMHGEQLSTVAAAAVESKMAADTNASSIKTLATLWGDHAVSDELFQADISSRLTRVEDVQRTGTDEARKAFEQVAKEGSKLRADMRALKDNQLALEDKIGAA